METARGRGTTGSSSIPAFDVAIDSTPRAARHFETQGSHFPILLGARETPSDTKQCAYPSADVACGKACGVRRVGAIYVGG